MSKLRLTLGILLVLSLAGINAWQYWLKSDPISPDLTMADIKGKTINLKSFQGKPVLISFWATSCGLCLMEMDDLVAVHNQYQAQGYTTIAIALSYDSLPRIKSITETKSLPYIQVFDQQGEYAKAFGGVRMTPTHFLISPAGKVVWQNVGTVDKDELQALIKSLLSSNEV